MHGRATHATDGDAATGDAVNDDATVDASDDRDDQ